MTAYTYTHPDIQRPDYCSCEPPWQTPTGPLKDGSHFSDCVAAEVAEDMAPLVSIVRDLAEGDAAPRSNGYWCYLCGAPREDHQPECPWRRAVEWKSAHPA